MRKTLREMGEFGLIERLSQIAGPGHGLLVGIGDDAAAWIQDEACLVLTTDMLVEGVHFDLALTGWRDLGWKALAVNLSDVAAMGAAPRLAFVSLGVPADTGVEDVTLLYEGMAELVRRAGCTIAGGDTVSAPAGAVINVVVLGTIPRDEADTVLRRDRGRPGDVVAVTGHLGASAAGLVALRAAAAGTGGMAGHDPLVDAHRRPEPRLEAGKALRRVGVRCAMDVSDGLLADLEKLCRASGCGAQVDAAAVPVHPEVRRRYAGEALSLAVGGGEDYELLFAGPEPIVLDACTALAGAGTPASPIGRLTGDAGVVRLVDPQGRDVAVPRRGWDHFADPDRPGG